MTMAKYVRQEDGFELDVEMTPDERVAVEAAMREIAAQEVSAGPQGPRAPYAASTPELAQGGGVGAPPTLRAWLDTQPWGALAQVAKDARVSVHTVYRLMNGGLAKPVTASRIMVAAGLRLTIPTVDPPGKRPKCPGCGRVMPGRPRAVPA